MAKIIDGRKLALKKEKKLARQVAELKRKTGSAPKLVSLMIGQNPASKLYLSLKQKAAHRVGVDFEKKQFSTGVDPMIICRFIAEKNIDPKVAGIMVQLPLPKILKIENYKLKILGSIEPEKDVDCLTPKNFGLLVMGKPALPRGRPLFLPATVKAVMAVLNSQFDNSIICNSHLVVIGASNIVGKPLAIHLSNLGATITICRSKTKNLAAFTRRADILISATGRPNLIKKEMVKKGAVVIDVGSPQGDVDFDQVKKVASFITPVPGGVGPLTVICLLENVFQAAASS